MVGFNFFVLIVNVMSYVNFILFVCTQYLRKHSNLLSFLTSPIFQTVNKPLDLMAGVVLLSILSNTQAKARS